jgi:ABC-type glycerol-3-phosphate transport system permease component
MIYGVWMSLQNVDVLRGTSSFIGLGNYLRLFQDGQFGLSVLNTAWYTLTVVPLIVIGSIVIAVFLRESRPARLIARVGFLIPFVLSPVVVATSWRWNDYLWPLIVIGDQKNFTLQLSLANLVGTNTVEWGTLLAYATLAMLPVLLVFLSFQRYFLKGSLSGGVKG